MSEIMVNSSGLSGMASVMSANGKILKNSHEKVEHVRANLTSNHTVFESVFQNRFDTIMDDMITEAARLDSLTEALKHIVKKYENCEKKIMNYRNADASDESKTQNSDASGSVSKLIHDFIQWMREIFGWDTEKQPVSREMEREHDLAMQSEIFALLNTDEFSQETWYNTSVNGRKKILRKFLKRLCAIMGVQVFPFIFFDDSMSDNTRGSYNHKFKMIYINSNRLSGNNSYGLMTTMIHEMRHAYQHAAVDNPEKFQVSEETISQWRENFKKGNYKSTDDGYTYEEYVSQPVEWDAKNFAQQYTDISNADPVYVGSWGE